MLAPICRFENEAICFWYQSATALTRRPWQEASGSHWAPRQVARRAVDRPSANPVPGRRRLRRRIMLNHMPFPDSAELVGPALIADLLFWEIWYDGRRRK